MKEQLISVFVCTEENNGKTIQKVIINKEIAIPYASGTGSLPVYKTIEEVYTFENFLGKTTKEKII